ncbi:uncharacterized protein BKA78DRAFT_166940 [Phyllosticta capitalensis]|uniref:uncharacterized protein n=1 Tax=Phyllosticta capitalensis TaxID=121624 RepID=UPI00312F62DB
MVRPRYYAALNEVRARRAELRREESSLSLASAVEVELELTMVLPTTTKITTNMPTCPTQQVARSPNYSTIVATEMELTLRSPQLFMVPALQQTPKPGSLLYSAPLHANGVPMYPVIPLPGQLVLEAEAGADMALEARDADAISDDDDDGHNDWFVQLGTNLKASPIPRPPAPTGLPRCNSKTFEGMGLDQDMPEGPLQHSDSASSSEMRLEKKLAQAHWKRKPES